MVTRLIRLSGVTLLCAVALFGAFSYSGVDYESGQYHVNGYDQCDSVCIDSSGYCLFGVEKALAYSGDGDIVSPDTFDYNGFFDSDTVDGIYPDWAISSKGWIESVALAWATVVPVGDRGVEWLNTVSNVIDVTYTQSIYRVLLDLDDAIEDVSNYLANIEYYTKQMFFDTGTISNRLNISNGKLDTIINHFSVIEDYLSFINSDDARESYLQQTNELLTYIMERLYYSGNSAAYWLYQIANKDFTIDGDIGDITVQTQDYTSQLNTIIALLGANLASNLTDAIQDITDDFYQKFIGDLGSVDVPSTMVSTMQSAVSSVFPFCLVGMFSTLIGVFDVDNSSFSPYITFDMWGDNPMTFDLSAFSVVIPLLHFFILIFLVYGLAMVTLGWFRAGEAK